MDDQRRRGQRNFLGAAVSDMTQHETEIAAAASKATFAGAGTTIFAWLTSSEFGVIAGIVIGVIGLAVNYYFRRRTDKREQREYEARMNRMGAEP